MKQLPENPWENGRSILVMIAAFLLVFAMLVICVNVDVYAVDPVVVRVRDFGRGMEPGVPPYARNDPEAISLSQNFYSTMPGGRQLRFGTVALQTQANDTAATDAVTMFRLKNDSSALVLAGGNRWWQQFIGNFWYRTSGGRPWGFWTEAPDSGFEIRPLPYGDSVRFINGSDTLWGFGTRFTRDLMVGDSLVIDTTRRSVAHIISDTRLLLSDSAIADTTSVSAWQTQRTYSDGVRPFFRQAGEYLYTGSVADQPQIIYSIDDTLRIRELKIVDSFYIDAVYSLYGDTTTRRSWQQVGDSAADTSRYVIHEFQLVSRRAGWGLYPGVDGWASDLAQTPNTYYCRLGYEASGKTHEAKYFQIIGNTDTSLYLSAWYIGDAGNDSTGGMDSGYIPTGSDSALWNSDVFLGVAPEFNDTLDAADVVGTWGYIYSSAGVVREVFADSASESITIKARGGLWYTLDEPAFDLDNLYDGLHFLRLTANDVSFAAFSDTAITRIKRYVEHYPCGSNWEPKDTSDVVVSERQVWGCQDRIGKWKYYDSPEDAPPRCGWVGGDEPQCFIEYVVYTTRTNIKTTDAQFIDRYYMFPIRWAERKNADTAYGWSDTSGHTWLVDNALTQADDYWNGAIIIFLGEWPPKYAEITDFVAASDSLVFDSLDLNVYTNNQYLIRKDDTLFFITSMTDAPDDTTSITTSNWDIVTVAMPRFAGMTEVNSQLVGWGDTLSGSMLSFSGYNTLNTFGHWDWTGARDVLVGNFSSDPIVSVVGYDDQMVIFKPHQIIGYPGFTELSQSDGLVGRKAVVGLNKYLYWLDADGMKRMARRDFSGYSVEDISGPLAPAFNAWNSLQWGTDVVPFKVNPRFAHLSILTHNQRDGHLYLFYPNGTDSANSRCLTYDIERNIWDGYFTIAANDAVWGERNDTSRIVMASPDSVFLFGLDYSWNDMGSGFAGKIVSHPFWVPGPDQWKWQVQPQRAVFRYRTFDGLGSDSCYLILVNVDEALSETLYVDASGISAVDDYSQVFRISTPTLGTYWRWELNLIGRDSTVNIFQPISIDLEFLPVTRDD